MVCNLAFFKKVPSPRIVPVPDLVAVNAEENPWNFEATAKVIAGANQ